MIDNHRNLKMLLVIFATVVLVRMFVFEGFVVRGSSMAPSIVSGDYVLIEKLSYKWREPAKGEVVVAENRQGQRVLKRVIGHSGEVYEVAGKPSYIDPGEYYLAGDNLVESIDSRDFGPVDTWDVKGRVFGSISIPRLEYVDF